MNMMRFPRKIQLLSVSKVMQLCLLLGLAVFCVIALKSLLVSPFTEHGTLQRILNEDTADVNKIFYDGRHRQSAPVFHSQELSNNADVGHDDYPGFVESTDIQPENKELVAAHNKLPTRPIRKNDRRKFVTVTRNDPFVTVASGGLMNVNPAIQQFLNKLPENFVGPDGKPIIEQPNIAQLGEQPIPLNQAQAQWMMAQQQMNTNQRPLETVPGANGNGVNVGNFAVGNNDRQQEAAMKWLNPQQAGIVDTATMTPVLIKEKLVHFDLKGAPPLVKYYKALFPLVKKMGATGLLMEYEDMFPYEGRLKISRAKNAYTQEDIVTIRKLAKENGLYIIPLVQTFGHLEFVLKHKEFKGVREVPNFPQAICPTRNGSFELVKDLIDQMMAAHPESTFLHIGADEVYQLGHCPVCSKFMAADQVNGRQMLFLSHVARVLTHIRRTYPQVRPIMWDDMFHTMTSPQILEGLGDLTQYVEPMIWSYYPDWGHHLPNNGDLYAGLFDNYWGATAFKGSAGETMQMPDIGKQLRIHTSWLEALSYNGHKMKNFRGIALTGWSRFDHFYPLCELLPAAIPTLAINLQILINGGLSMAGIQKSANVLQCLQVPANLDFVNYDPYLEGFSTCSFPGVEVYQSIHNIMAMTKMMTEHVTELENKFPEYQSRQGYVQQARVEEVWLKLNNSKTMLEHYMKMANSSFAIVFDQSVYNEWMVSYVLPSLKAAQKWQEIFGNASLIDTWPSRPLQLEQLPIIVEVSTVKYVDPGLREMAEKAQRALSKVEQPIAFVANRQIFH